MKTFLLFVSTFLSIFMSAQNKFEIKEGDKVVIPFKLINNLIFVQVTLNGAQLTFLLDTGVSETTIFSLENTEMKLENLEKMKFAGLGNNESVEGFKSDLNTAVIAKNYINTSCALYIILDQDINISSHVGIPVNGILGYHFFKDHPMIINFATKKITVYKNQNLFLNKVKKFDALPISIETNKPYVLSDVKISKSGTASPSKLLIDLGNSDAVWLFPALIPDFIYNRPNIDDYLGRGFNGDVYGKRSRIYSFALGKFDFIKPLAAMPDEFSIQHVNLVPGRKGSLGGEILRRFTVAFDYQNEKVYLKKNGFYDDPFHFNMSGLDFEQVGVEWQKDVLTLESKAKNEASNAVNVINNNLQYKFVLKPVFSIAGVRKDSPGEKAGLKKGDRLISINRRKTSEMTLNKIIEMMKSDEGKSIIMVIERKDREITVHFTLEDPIPYQE